MSPRYQATCLTSSDEDPLWASSTSASFQDAFQDQGLRPWTFRKSYTSARPFGHFTLKQKSLLCASPPIVVSDCTSSASTAVCSTPGCSSTFAPGSACPTSYASTVSQPHPHIKLHQGPATWLKTVSSHRSGMRFFAEWDASDCFLNTPRGEVSGASAPVRAPPPPP